MMNFTMKTLSILFFMAITLQVSMAQCETWIGSAQKGDAEDAHTVYRQSLKDGDMVTAFEYWQIAYAIAPAADGNRDFHYMDGVKIYKDKLKNEPEAKAEILAKIDELYRGAANCYESGVIKVHKCAGAECGKEKAGKVLGRYGYAMVYDLATPLSKVYEVFKESLEKAGMNSEYVVLNPYAHVAVNLYKQKKITAEEARAIHEELNAIADYNVKHDKKYSSQFEQAKSSMNALWSPIESEIFDCEYFKKKYEATYRENPTDIENLKVVYSVLVKNGCDDSDPLVAEIKQAYEAKAAKMNAAAQAEYELNNPAMVAKKLYDAEDYSGAILKYREAIAAEADPVKQGSYYFSIASIQGRKLSQYSEARNSARKAMELRPDWGRPLMLIGDMYARSSNSCGKDAYERGLVILAALDKWQAAKRVDAEVADEAQKSINKYSAYIPPSEDVFMNPNVSEGQTVSTGCWVSERVTLRVK